MFRLNPFVRVGLCLSAISCAWPVLAVDDDGETMVVTASSVEQNLKDAPASISVIISAGEQRRKKPYGFAKRIQTRAEVRAQALLPAHGLQFGA